MNEQQVVALFDRTAEAVAPDVARLVAAGADRGRRHRRRRAVTTAVATVAVLGAATLVTGAALSGTGDPAPHPTDVSSSPRGIAVTPDDMSVTLAGLLPGARPVEDHEPFQFQVQRGVVAWQGSRVILTIDSRGLDADGTAQEHCETYLDMACDAGPDGSWVAAHGYLKTADGNRPEHAYDAVRVYERDGYVVEAAGLVIDPSAEDADARSQANRDILRELALDDVWLR